MAPPTDETVESYERVRQARENIGRPLIDMMLTDGDAVQSLSLALDPEFPGSRTDPRPAPETRVAALNSGGRRPSGRPPRENRSEGDFSGVAMAPHWLPT